MSLSSNSPVREGDVVAGKYRVERVLGEGGMGVVVAARHVELGELFALKFLLPHVLSNKEVCTRFAREARTGIRIKNEHVARVFDVGTLADGAPYMVMEHLMGEDLAAHIARRGPLPVEEAVDLLLQACEAICEAHELGVVHRDLKPANLFITTGSDGVPFVKVLDFGISKSVEGEDLSVTATAAVLGSPLYMSPEQLTSSRNVDRRSDVWSLGVILYEMLTGKTPFAGESFPTLCAAILGGRYDRMSTRAPTLTAELAELDDVVSSALALDRNARLASIRELSARLTPFGSQIAKASDLRISRISARSARAATASPIVTPPLALAATEDASVPGRVTDNAASEPRDTAAALSRSSTGRQRSGSSWAPPVIVLSILAAAGLSFVAWNGHRAPGVKDAVDVTPPVAGSAPAATSAAAASVDPMPDTQNIARHGAPQAAPSVSDPSTMATAAAAAPSAKPLHHDPLRASPAATSSSNPRPRASAPSPDRLFNGQE